jgi:hypothetical protein
MPAGNRCANAAAAAGHGQAPLRVPIAQTMALQSRM